MVGKFDPQLRINTRTGKITVSGPLRWDAADAGKTVKIEATITQPGNRKVECSADFTAPNGSGTTFPVFTAWSMEANVGDLTVGMADGSAAGKRNGDVINAWKTPDPQAPTPELQIQIVTTP
jgi:hypothetical protein